ncbi:hypothetical protein LSCM1_06953 [Leishmania martiniquensis]|uniref:Uncharacterized protein n=1 Tax=Leishmania martiniquensis TaxID=1580590 RepID=A0A836KQC0_9TRYP|nr:hypothetical protein LSCM1_06953 [Leishmania martiniquensis]
MPLLVQRTYKLGAGSATDAEELASSASPLMVPGAPAEHVTTRVCHHWSYVDPSRRETCIVTLQAHYSLHVDVKGEGGTASPSSPQQMGGHAEVPCSDDGLCGFAWELLWIPCPSVLPDAAGAVAAVGSSSDDLNVTASLEAHTPARARFFFPRTTSLAPSTLAGTGGVLFMSSRHVLIATEATTAASAASGPSATWSESPSRRLDSAAHYSLMDSFVLKCSDTASARSVPPARLWTRVAASAALPYLFAAPQAPGHVSATSVPSSQSSTALLLVAGVPLPPPHHTSAAADEAPLMRLVYVCAAVGSAGSAPLVHRTWDLVACVADLSVTGGSADNPTQLHARLRHAVVLPQLSLSVQRAATVAGAHRAGRGYVGCSTDGANRTQPLAPSDLLWAFVEDTNAQGVHPIHDGQLCGSLVALLPCCRAPVRASTAPSLIAPVTAAASLRVGCSAPSPPAILCMGFRADTPHGALGVSSAALDSHATPTQQQRERTSPSSLQDIVEQLLPSRERAVYELSIGRPTKHIGPPATDASRGAASASAAATLTVLPEHTALLMLIMDGIHSRSGCCSRAAEEAEASRSDPAAMTALPRGLYLTDTLPWDALAPLASPQGPEGALEERKRTVRAHRVPPNRTLWRGLDPLVLSAAATPTSASAIMDGESGEENGAMQSMRQADHRDALAWDVADMARWAESLSGTTGGSSDGAYGRNHHAIPMADDSAAEAEGTATFASHSFMATVTAVASSARVPSSVSTAGPTIRGLPCFNELTHELTMLWCYSSDATGHSEEEDEAATELAIALVRPSLSLSHSSTATEEEWEAQVVEWVAAEQLRRHLDSSATPPSEAAVAVATYRAVRVLMAYAVLHEARPDPPRWPRVLMEVVRSTTVEAEEHRTRLHVYARAVQTFTTARLVKCFGDDTAKQEAEVRHMRRAARLFLRLMLRTLVELDWGAADALGRLCCQWVVRWFLGSGAATSAAGTTRPSPITTADTFAEQEQDAGVEGRAIQVLLQLGVAAPSSAPSPLSMLDWLRRALLLFACRHTELPLELMIDDIVEASGLLRHSETTPDLAQATATDGWSEASDQETAASRVPPWPARDTAELRESIEYALLRLVKPEELYRVVHHLASVSPTTYLHRSSTSAGASCGGELRGRRRLVVRGVLTVADLHALVCAGWAPGRPHDAAPPSGFTFVCCVVDVAMAFVSEATPASTDTVAVAEVYEQLVVTALDAWGERGGCEEGQQAEEASHAPAASTYTTERVPVYPLLNTPEAEGSAAATTTRRASTPFPFTLLPPLLTVYLWYHVTHRICTALQLLPPSTPDADAAGGEPPLAPRLRRAKLRDGDELRALHRGVCVLRCLTQEDAACAEDIFAAMRLVYDTPHRDVGHPSAHRQGAHAGLANRIGPTATTATAASSLWVSQYVAAWHHLLSLEAPPLCSAGALRAYQERCFHAPASTTPHAGDVMRVMHLLYASAGNGRVLRAQVLRAMGLQQQQQQLARKVAAEGCIDSYAVFARALQQWRITARERHRQSTAESSVKKRRMRSEGAVATGTIAAWLVQIWASVLLCDSGAVTDVGMYEHLFTALAHAKQQGEQLNTITTATAADVTFALLRPCLLYALPVLEQLAVEEELKNSSGGRSSEAALVYLQYNEPLTWNMNSAMLNGKERPHIRRATERLCAGEVCERVRRQLQRIVALFEWPPSASSGVSSTRGTDARFGIVAQLMALQPTAANLAAVQRRIALCRVKKSPRQRSTSGDVTAGRRSASTQSSASAASGAGESGLELRNFFLPPAAVYVVAATAVAMHHAKSRTSASQGESSRGFPLSQSPSAAASPMPVGWLVVGCEVLRRELRCYMLTELQLNGYVEKPAAMDATEAANETAPEGITADAAANHPSSLEPCWLLVASGVQLKAFINALADAVEPLTCTLAQAMPFVHIRPLVLLLVLDVLHALLHSSADTHEVKEAADGTARCMPEVRASSPPVVTCTDASLLPLLQQWIRGVAVPLHERMNDADKKVLEHILTVTFAREYLSTPRGEGAAAPPGRAAARTTSYRASNVHAEWRQWRDKASARSVSGKESAMMGCLSSCVAAGHQQLMHMALPKQIEDEAPQEAAAAVPRNSLGLKTTSHSAITTAASIGSHWLDAGSALRTSLLNTIGATVAPRAAQQQQQPQQHARTSSPAVASPPPLQSQPQAVRANVSEDGRTVGLTVADTDELQLLCKEEAFKRRQCCEQLLRERRQFFASAVFQGNLLRLYVALRTEKRRRALEAFALEQHDLIFTLAYREQLLRLDEAREALRHVWCEWGERQRLATRRLLQEERDARMGVQAINYAGWSLLRHAERQERRVWVLYEEGRASIAALEDDARDALALAAARAHLELTKRAAEAEEEAYWKAEESAWARMCEEEGVEETDRLPHPPPLSTNNEARRDGGRMLSPSRASSSSPANPPSSSSADRPTVTPSAEHARTAHGDAARVASDDNGAAALKHIRRGGRKGLGGGAAAVVTLHSSCSDTTGPRRASDTTVSASVQQQQQAPPHSASLETHSEHALPGWSGGLAHGAVQSAISSASGLFNALSQWPTALRDTVAPPPPTRVSGRTMARQAAVLDAAGGFEVECSSVGVLTAKEAAPRAPAVAPETCRAARSDDWGWSSDSGEDAQLVEVKSPEWAREGDGRRADNVLPPAGRHIVPQRGAFAGGETPVAAAPPPSQCPQSAKAAANLVPAVNGARSSMAAARLPRKKKRFAAAAILVEPVSSASAPAAPPASPPPLPPFQSVKQRPQQQQGRPPSPGDPVIPNPARSILWAIEAEATEMVSGLTGAARTVSGASSATSGNGSRRQQCAPSPLCTPDGLPLRAAAALRPIEGVERQVWTETLSGSVAADSGLDARGAGDVDNAGSAVENEDGWGWSDDDKTVELGVSKVAPAVSPPPPPAAAAARPKEAPSPPAPYATSVTAAHEPHELRGRRTSVEPLPLPATHTIEVVPLPNARVEDGWGWSDDEANTEGTCVPPPPLSAHLPDLGSDGVKDGWSRGTVSFGSDIAVPAPGTAVSEAPPAPLGPVAAPSTRSEMLKDLQEVYAAEVDVRAQLVELL